MSQDSQTDRGYWWSITSFDEAEQNEIASQKWPSWVKNIYGGLEECPDTKRVHYQGAIHCRTQQRFSAVKRWLKKAHIELAREPHKLKQYAMKDETAVGEKKVLENLTPFVDNQSALRLLAQEEINNPAEVESTTNTDMDKVMEAKFRVYANRVVFRDPYLVGVMSKPDILRGWKLFGATFVKLEREGRADSITARPKNEVVETDVELDFSSPEALERSMARSMCSE